MLTVLRNCCGALEDLAEVSRRPAGAPVVVAPCGPPGGLAEGKESSEAKGVKEEEGSGAAPPDKAEASIPEVKDKKKDKTKSKKEKKAKSEDSKAGGEATPEKKKGTKEKKRKNSDPIKEETEVKEGASSSRGADPQEETGEELQDRVDRYVSAHPENFALGSLPVRGSAARYLRARADERDHRTPAEPREPPRHRDGGSSRRWTARRRQPGERPKKSKGARHRQRGRDWAARRSW